MGKLLDRLQEELDSEGALLPIKLNDVVSRRLRDTTTSTKPAKCASVASSPSGT